MKLQRPFRAFHLRGWLAPVLLGVVLGTCAAHRAAPDHPPTPADEDEVFAAVFDTLAVAWNAPRFVVDAFTQRWRIERRDAGYRGMWGSLASLPGIAESTLTDFEARHADARRIGPLPPTRVPITIVGETDLADLPYDSALGGWTSFRAKYPGARGVLTLSRPGFSSDRTQAVLLVGYRCGVRCNNGRALLLARNRDGWRVVADRVLWIH